jgi:cell division protein FtsW
VVLACASAAFAVVAFRALESAGATMPADTDRILLQFLLTGLTGHIALRLLAPQSPAQPYAIALLLAAIGLVFTSRLVPDLAQDQANWITIGVTAMVLAVIACRFAPRFRQFTYTSAVLALLLLLVTGIFGTTLNGARLWLDIGGQYIQTTELIKVLVVAFLAGFLAERGSVLANPRFEFGGRTYSALPYLVPLILALGGAVMALALLKDLGSVALLLLFGVTMLYVASGRLLYVAGGLVLLAATAALGFVMFDHAQVRIETWVDPYEDSRGAGYQTVQSIYAIEAGGITGEGLGLGEADIIPAAATDYVFSAVVEELGATGGFAVVALYVVFLVAGLRTAVACRDAYMRLFIAGVAILIAIQAAVIIAGNLRLIPTTGITLPFVSYGGSSLVVNFALLGLLLGMSHYERSRS